ncbi:hypothetical protein Zmor_025770 [Zophobas morio]|uniref:non-specific serine/threonine protein kinase n=1 Tax=Zophobas morio TaxID=2755281 RepID=A0AA38HUT2_9CUCU|nr:hypothetical protein Zmor_025770 [Zophobas morio]
MAKAPKKPRKKATNGYNMPDPLPAGELLTDIAKKQWILGTSIGKGGFGEIYCAKEASSKASKYPYVVKVEPHGNGPLFVEMHFYMKNAKQADVDTFMKKHKLKTFGMPVYLGSGSHEAGSMKYRFIVMEKFGTDIDKIRAENKGVLPLSTVFQLAWQITYVLEYIHELGYVHADIKGGNIILGISPATKNQMYLLDFGLATKFTTEKQFKPNPKKAHDGTIEYLSRDAHHGVPTRRGDFEILGYNLIQWLGGTLPWESKLDNPKEVQQMKETSMDNIPQFVKRCLKKTEEVLVKYLEYVNNLTFDEKPDYKKIRSLFEQEIKKNGASVNGPLEFHTTPRKRRSVVPEIDDQELEEEVEVKKPVRKRGKKQDEEVAPEVEKKRVKKREVEQLPVETGHMTEAMKKVLARKKEREAEKKKKPNKK